MESDDFYRGQNWSQVIFIFLVRLVAYFLGLASLVYMDLSAVTSLDGKRPICLGSLAHFVGNAPVAAPMNSALTLRLSLWTFLFYATVMIRDIFFIMPMCVSRLRPFLLAILHFAMVAISIYGRIKFQGFVFAACMMISLYELNLREGRWFYSGSKPRKGTVSRRLILSRVSYLP
jgi:hypothetical protein